MQDVSFLSLLVLMIALLLVTSSGSISRSSANSSGSSIEKPANGSPASLQLAGDIEKMTGHEFEEWLAVQRGKMETGHEAPVPLEAALLKRLRAGRYVTDEVFLSIIHAWTSYESRRLSESGATTHAGTHFQDSRRLIDELDAFTYGRPSLKASFHQEKANLFAIDQDRDNEAKECEKAIELLSPLQIAIDEQRLRTIVQLADVRYALGDKKRAETGYLQALSFDFAQVLDPVAFHTLKDIYVHAARGLIDCRRGNLMALRDIYFLPAVKRELDPVLTAAIQDAQPVQSANAH